MRLQLNTMLPGRGRIIAADHDGQRILANPIATGVDTVAARVVPAVADIPERTCAAVSREPVPSRPAQGWKRAAGRRGLGLIVLAAALLLPFPRAAHAGWTSSDGSTDPSGPLQRAERRELAQMRAAAAATGGPDDPKSEIVDYVVQPGDTLYGLADTYGISVETLIWANKLEANPQFLSLGQHLLILPVTGVLHTVQPGDTLGGIAQRYKGDVDEIRKLPANHLQDDDYKLMPGQKVIVPDGVKPRPAAPVSPAVSAPPAQSAPAPAGAPTGGGHLIWPVGGSVSQGFHPYHPGIDIGAPGGTPVKAADGGYVAVAGWSNVGYGNYIVIDHRNGERTLYAHLSRIDVKAGQAVEQGAVIGAVGSTGNATGPHLHFEVHRGGAVQNPLSVLG